MSSFFESTKIIVRLKSRSWSCNAFPAENELPLRPRSQKLDGYAGAKEIQSARVYLTPSFDYFQIILAVVRSNFLEIRAEESFWSPHRSGDDLKRTSRVKGFRRLADAGILHRNFLSLINKGFQKTLNLEIVKIYKTQLFRFFKLFH